MKKNHYSINLIGRLFCFLLLTFFSFQSNAYPAPSDYFDTVQKIYIGYYQRPADPGGLIYWAGRLDTAGGSFAEIIEAYANSAESQALYGTINSGNISTVVNGIYYALFGRNAEPEGLNYYVAGFNSGQFTPATIMLNVLYGAQSTDLQSVNNKLTAANLFTRTIDPELDGSNFQVTYAGDGDAVAGRNFLTLYATSVKVPTQAETTAYIRTNIANSGDAINTVTATFDIVYIADGGTDRLGRNCTTFPEDLKAPFLAATSIWGKLLHSSVPITIKACWASSIGMIAISDVGRLKINFENAPRLDTYYCKSLANALAGYDVDDTEPDMYITFNSNYFWYKGTDGNPFPLQMDFRTVALHEIGHGLCFGGSASYSGGQGSLGVLMDDGSLGSVKIYDTFIKDGLGNPLTGYPNQSTSLGSVLTGGDLWFHGSNAMAANGGSRVKMCAPSPWKDGRSYYHLDYNTFLNTENQLMVPDTPPGYSTDNPGPITKGLLKDLGWPASPAAATLISPSGTINITTPTYAWNAVSNASYYQVRVNGSATWYAASAASCGGGIGTCSITGSALTAGSYTWDVQTRNSYGDGPWSGYMNFTVQTGGGIPPNMVLIPAGSFQMGDAIDGESWAIPVHTVTLSAFYLDKYEVTKALWDEVYTWAIAHGYTFDNAGAGTAANHPVQTVSWYDVVKWLNARSEKEGRTPVYYTNLAQTTIYKTGQVNVTNGMVKWTATGYRLPTEAEWEYAARGGTTTRFYTGNCISTDQANYRGDYPWTGCPSGQDRGGTTAVGSFAANPWGLYDMAGNVWEWTWDWYGSYSSSAVTNPRGPGSGSYRILRGGSWESQAYFLRSIARTILIDFGDPSAGPNSLGFRSALSKISDSPGSGPGGGYGETTPW